jgi:hypothetical protein
VNQSPPEAFVTILPSEGASFAPERSNMEASLEQQATIHIFLTFDLNSCHEITEK